MIASINRRKNSRFSDQLMLSRETFIGEAGCLRGSSTFLHAKKILETISSHSSNGECGDGPAGVNEGNRYKKPSSNG